MVVHVYSCLLTRIIPVQIHTGIITWNATGVFMFKLIHVPVISGKQGMYNKIYKQPIDMSAACSGFGY